MSLILEALRKSEAQRRRAQAPDLFAEPATVTRPIAPSPPRWLWPALAAIAALLMAGWFARGAWNAPMEPVPAPADAAPPAPATSATIVRPATIADTSPRVAIAVTSAPDPAAAGEPAAPSLPAVSAPARTWLEPTLVAPNAGPANAARPPATSTAATPAPAPVKPATAAIAPPPQPAPISDAPLRLADLSSEERLQLPALKMSMHLWDAASTQRFVILDGQRMGEGARLGDVVVEVITPDGVVLAWHGRRLMLPMR